MSRNRLELFKSQCLFCFLIACFFLITGCVSEYNLATGKQETYMIGTEREVKMGFSVSKKIEENFDVIEDVEVNDRVERILEKIVKVCDRKDIVYFIKVLDKDLINAVSLPGGYIYLFKGIIDNAENDDQLAGVIAHEVAHITAKHSVKRLQNAYGALFLQVAAAQSGGRLAAGVGLAMDSLFTEYSQKDEFMADRLAVKYVKKAGYDPQEIVNFFKILQKDSEKQRIRPFSYWKTHPYVTKRIAVVNQEIKGKLEFKDYILLTEDEQW